MEILNMIDIKDISFGVLFLWLLIDYKKDSKQRELKYQEIITNLASKFNLLEDIKEDINEIKKEMRLTNE